MELIVNNDGAIKMLEISDVNNAITINNPGNTSLVVSPGPISSVVQVNHEMGPVGPKGEPGTPGSTGPIEPIGSIGPAGLVGNY